MCQINRVGGAWRLTSGTTIVRLVVLTIPAQIEGIAIIRIIVCNRLGFIAGNTLENIRITKVNPQVGDIRIINTEIKGQAVIAGQVRNLNTGSGTGRKLHGLTEGPAVYIDVGPVLRVEGAVEAGTVSIVAVKVLEAERIWVIHHQVVVGGVIVDIQAADLNRRQGGTVAAILQFEVVDVGNVSDMLAVINVVVDIVDGDKGWGVLDINQIVLIRAVINGDVVLAVILIVIKIILGIVVIVRGIVIVPGFELCAVGVVIVIGGVLVQEIFQFDICLIVVCVIRGIMNSVEGLIVAVDNLGIGGITATVVVGNITVFVLHTIGRGSIVVLGFVRRKKFIKISNWIPTTNCNRIINSIKPF